MLDSMFDDVKRMDKRQFLYQVPEFYNMIGLDSFLIGFIFWHDRVFRIDDLEGIDGGDWIRVSHCGGAQWQHGTSFPEGGSVVPH